MFQCVACEIVMIVELKVCFLPSPFQVVDDLEAELNTIEKNIPKIEAILSSMDNSHISLTEHLHNRQVMQSIYSSFIKTLA